MSKGSSSKLADTTFNTQPDDKLSVVDVYESASSEIENSFQDAYHKAEDIAKEFESLGKSAADIVNNAISEINSKADLINNVLNGIKTGNIDSLISLTGGASSGLKQISDAFNTVNKAINTVNGVIRGVKGKVDGVINTVNRAISKVNSTVNKVVAIGNALKGGLNSKALLKRIANNVPLVKQIQKTIRDVGTIKNSFNSLEQSLGRASNLLSGDKSSLNTIYNGVTNKARNIITATKYDIAVTTEQTEHVLGKIRDINSQIGSAVSSLPRAAQDVLVRGFSDESANRNLIIGGLNSVTSLSREASVSVIKPISSIINSFTGEDDSQVKIQDPGAISTLVSGITNLAGAAGFKNTFSIITKNITNAEIVVSAAKPLVMRAMETGDLDTIMDIANSSAVSEMKRFAPNVIENICYNVNRPHDMSQQEFAPYYENVKKAFNSIDKDWMVHKSSSGNNLINGAAISSNAFMCDIIEASLNEKNNVAITKTNRQIVNDKTQPASKLTKQNEEKYEGSSFVNEMERAVDNLNQKAYETMIDNGETIIRLPEKTLPEIVIAEVEEEILDFSNEKFLLLASVFIDNSVESEIEKHMPHLNERFKHMGSFA